MWENALHLLLPRLHIFIVTSLWSRQAFCWKAVGILFHFLWPLSVIYDVRGYPGAGSCHSLILARDALDNAHSKGLSHFTQHLAMLAPSWCVMMETCALGGSHCSQKVRSYLGNPQLFLRAAEWQCQLSAVTGACMKVLRGLISKSRSATVKMFTPVKRCDLVSWDHGLPCQHQLSFPMWNSALLVITNVKIIYMCGFYLWNASIIFFLYLSIFWVKTCGECLNVSCDQSRLCCR